MKKRISVRVLQLMLMLAMIIGVSLPAYASRDVVHPDVGYYRIVATNGHGNGKELYYDRKASKRESQGIDISMIYVKEALYYEKA